jgi:hypothetical protein
VSKKALVVGLVMLAIGFARCEASDKEARWTLVHTGAEIRHYEGQGQYGTRVVVGDGFTWKQWSKPQYEDARMEFVLALIEIAKQERSNEKLKQLMAVYFPAFNDTILDVRDKERMREELVAKVAFSLGLRTVEYKHVSRKGTLFGDLYYVYTYKNGTTKYRKLEY